MAAPLQQPPPPTSENPSTALAIHWFHYWYCYCCTLTYFHCPGYKLSMNMMCDQDQTCGPSPPKQLHHLHQLRAPPPLTPRALRRILLPPRLPRLTFYSWWMLSCLTQGNHRHTCKASELIVHPREKASWKQARLLLPSATLCPRSHQTSVHSAHPRRAGVTQTQRQAHTWPANAAPLPPCHPAQGGEVHAPQRHCRRM